MTASCPSGGEDQLHEISSAPGLSSYWMGSVQPGPFFFVFFCSCSWTFLPPYSIFLNMLHLRFLHLPNNSSVQESLEAVFVGILANSQWPSASTCHEDMTSNEPFIPGLADEVRKLRLRISRILQCIGRSTSQTLINLKMSDLIDRALHFRRAGSVHACHFVLLYVLKSKSSQGQLISLAHQIQAQLVTGLAIS